MIKHLGKVRLANRGKTRPKLPKQKKNDCNSFHSLANTVVLVSCIPNRVSKECFCRLHKIYILEELGDII